MKIKKNKRGFLLGEETLKIIIAVICIGFLAYFLFLLYSNSKDSTDLEFAKESLNHLIDEINDGKTEIEIYNPKNWVIGVWPHEFKEYFVFIETGVAKGMPKSCSNLIWESCICICKNDNPDECDKNGICLENDIGLDVEGKNIQISETPFKLKIEEGVVMKNELG